MPASSSSSSSSSSVSVAPIAPAQVFWVGNAQAISQVETINITAVPGAGGGTLTATISDKTITYTTLSTDTTATAATAWQALLSAAGNSVPEFAEVTFAVNAAGTGITCTAATAGLPFTLTSSAAGGATLNQVHTTANGSPNDAGNNNNWFRNGVYLIPQNGDDVIVADSSVSILYNLAALANVNFNSFTRYNTFTGQIGLPENNPAGYYEYRPTYFQFAGNQNPIQCVIGLGPGSGATLERYNTGSQQCAWTLTGAPSVRILNSNSQSVYTVNGATLDIATLPTETANCSGGVTVANGGTLNLGQGVTFNGTLNVNSASVAFCNCVPSAIVANAGTVTMNATGGTCTVNGTNSSAFAWNSSTNVSNLQLSFGSTFDKTNDLRPILISAGSVDGTCQVIDPWNTITMGANFPIPGGNTSGVWVFGPGKTLRIS